MTPRQVRIAEKLAEIADAQYNLTSAIEPNAISTIDDDAHSSLLAVVRTPGTPRPEPVADPLERGMNERSTGSALERFNRVGGRGERRPGARSCDRRAMGLTCIAAGSGPKGARTPDLMAASHALYQLSYGPVRPADLPCSPSTPLDSL
jgi:hypothetical protein